MIHSPYLLLTEVFFSTTCPCTFAILNRTKDVSNWQSWFDRKKHLSTNVFAAATFDLLFTFVMPGAEGCASDSQLFNIALREKGFVIPQGFYYLGDAGFALMDCLLTPYRKVRYHLKDFWDQGANQRFVALSTQMIGNIYVFLNFFPVYVWTCMGFRYLYTMCNCQNYNMYCLLLNHRRLPVNKKELFNHRHSSFRICIERTFGVWKRRFPVLRQPLETSVRFQIRMIKALAGLHNFILIHEGNVPADLVIMENYDRINNIRLYNPHDDVSSSSSEEDVLARGHNWRDDMANRMWMHVLSVRTQNNHNRH